MSFPGADQPYPGGTVETAAADLEGVLTASSTLRRHNVEVERVKTLVGAVSREEEFSLEGKDGAVECSSEPTPGRRPHPEVTPSIPGAQSEEGCQEEKMT
ncbi:hypothetical protein NDU88_003326 [Pleurodeles waltl]|uniref:Uncharacterized protein n=1 Tax=Pleurodeles waltl TaxID=8319 RepID=A0AAV7LFI7_PLEWA|nr:hypothetical protein NDU88_003326 [Pleurodeles waltl]